MFWRYMGAVALIGATGGERQYLGLSARQWREAGMFDYLE